MPKVVDIDERRRELADAAARVIARAGVGAATMREVAAEAGWTTGALTHYFADKRELLLYTFRASLEQRRGARDARQLDQPFEALVSALEGALPLDEERRRHWMVTIALCAQAAGDDELSTAQRDAYRMFRSRVAELIDAADIAPEADARARAEQLIAVADGIAVQALFDPAGWSPPRQLRTLRNTMEVLITTSSDAPAGRAARRA